MINDCIAICCCRDVSTGALGSEVSALAHRAVPVTIGYHVTPVTRLHITLESLLTVNPQVFRTAARRFLPYLRATAYMREFATKDYVEEFHVIYLATSTHHICYPLQTAIDLNDRSSVVCATFLEEHQVGEPDHKPRTYLILDHQGEYYERIGMFITNGLNLARERKHTTGTE
jgi:hypothetical protein